MKTIIRGIVWLALVVWLGAEFFLVIAATAAFTTLPNQPSIAGSIVRICLIALHREGFWSGAIIIALLAVGLVTRVFRRTAVPAIAVTLLMLGLTAYSQFSIIPRMDTYLRNAGGAIENLPPTNPNSVGFNHLHKVSVDVESGVMVGGVVLVFLLAHAAVDPRPRKA